MIKVLELFEPVAIAVSLIGMIIMVWGIITCFFSFFRSEWKNTITAHAVEERENIRVQLGTYLLLGLEFLIAADILHSAHHPQLESLYVLGMIVLIRTVISFFLNRELPHKYERRGDTNYSKEKNEPVS